MGTVLAMTRRLQAFARLCAFGLVLGGLAGCGTQSSQLAGLARETFSGLLQRGAPPPPPLRARLTPEVLATLGPILIVELQQSDSEAGAQLIRSTADTEIWATLNGIQFTFRKGVLQSTRGLAGDLMAADVSEVLSGLATGGRGKVRVHRYLDGEHQEVARALICDYTRAGRETLQLVTGTFGTTRIDETCVSSSETVQNQYWVDGRGVMRKSRQWVGPISGFVLFERIND